MWLYKYLTSERIDVLQRGLIRFTQAKSLNDPFELQPGFTKLERGLDFAAWRPTPDQLETMIRQQVVSVDLNPAQKEQVEALIGLLRRQPELLEPAFKQMEPLFSAIEPVLLDRGREQLADGLRSRIGVLSLSEISNDPTMWAHYGSNHRGYVIGFTVEHPYFNRARSEDDQFFHLRKVDYETPPTEPVFLKSMRTEDILFRKDECWSHEREWRMLVPFEIEVPSDTIDVDEVPIHLFRFPGEAVGPVILGANASNELEQEVRRLTSVGSRYPNAVLGRARLDTVRRTIEVPKLYPSSGGG
jgi:Protein of unknown function (DUF2971)